MNTIQQIYLKTAAPALKKRFSKKSIMAVPKLQKVTLNTGFGKVVLGKTGDEPRKFMESVIEDLSALAGQKAVLAKARKSVATFKLRKGMPIGAMVTLRGKRMDHFLTRLFNIVLPRSRDFQGISAGAVDSKGNLTIGMKEHIFFPEIAPEKMHQPFGLEITITTTAKTREEGLALFELLGIPFKK